MSMRTPRPVNGSDGEPVEVTEYVVASDRVETVHVLRRDESARDPWLADAGQPADDQPDR
jgi:hypothetical protein